MAGLEAQLVTSIAFLIFQEDLMLHLGRWWTTGLRESIATILAQGCPKMNFISSWPHRLKDLMISEELGGRRATLTLSQEDAGVSVIRSRLLKI